MSAEENEVIWLTQEAFDRLQAEMDDRSGALRSSITARIEAAREEGDLKENGGYHAAKEEQGKNEARIRQLRHMLEHAQVGAPEHDGTVRSGSLVTIRFSGDDETETFLLGSREEAAHATVAVYSVKSPMGSAVLGREVGDSASYTAPNGRTISLEVVAVEPYTG
ncbi:MAG TPA: transcription elongation factor GreA [Actinobacteria bacterium]|nr:transcription elongation factor GreA [Actinomycetota bacterium]